MDNEERKWTPPSTVYDVTIGGKRFKIEKHGPKFVASKTSIESGYVQEKVFFDYEEAVKFMN